MRRADILLSNCSFIQNIALGTGGVLFSDDSTLLINHTLFRSNTACSDGGALSTLVYPSNYTIIQSSFIANHAGDDGGAAFIGQMGSFWMVERSLFTDNDASDRGGAVAIFGSTMTMISTNVNNNIAGLGKSISACSSEVETAISHGQTDPVHSSCLNYDSNVNSHSIPIIQEHVYPDIFQLNHYVKKISPCAQISITESSNTLQEMLQRASSAAYTALTLSVTVAIGVVLYFIITRAMHNRNRTSTRRIGQDHSDPVYDHAQDHTMSTDAKSIEMVPNVVYGRRSVNNAIAGQ